MAHLNKKKLSLSERFGTIGPVDYQRKACKNSALVNKLQMQITEVVRKRTDGNVRESQAKMISEEIFDVQQRHDDAPVACQKFTPFKVELKVNMGNNQAENKKNTDRNVRNYNAGNNEVACESRSNKTDHNEKSLDHGNRIEQCHDSGLNHNPIKGYGTKNNRTNTTTSGFTAEKQKFENDVQGSIDKCRNDESDLDTLSSPKFHQGTSSLNTHQHDYVVDQNPNKESLQKSAENVSPQNTAKTLPIFQEMPKKRDQYRSPGNKKTNQSWQQQNNTGNSSEQNNKNQNALFKETNNDRLNVNDNGAQTSQKFNKGQSCKSSSNFNKGKGPTFKKGKGSDTSPKFNKGQGSKASPNVNKGQGFKNCPKFNSKQGLKTSPNFNNGPGYKASPNLNTVKGRSFQTSPNLNKGQSFQMSPNLKQGHGFPTSPNLNKGQGFQTSPNLNKGQGFQTSPNLNKGQGFQTSPNLNKGQGFQTSPNLNKGQGFQTSPNLNKGQGFPMSPNLNKGHGFPMSPNLNKGQGVPMSPNLNKGHGSRASENLNKGQGFQTNPSLNKGQGFQTSQNFNKGQGIQTNPSFNRRQGFQTSPKFSQSPDFQVHHMNDTRKSANSRQCSEISPDRNKRGKFHTSSNFNNGKDFQAGPNFNQGLGFQASPGIQNNASKSFGCNKSGSRNIQDSQTGVQQHFASTDAFASNDPSTIYDIQDQFYNYQSGKRFPKGRQQTAKYFNNKSGFGGHQKNRQHSFPSNPPHQYHVNQARQSNFHTSTNNVIQPQVYTYSEQSYNAGSYGKRHASPVGSNKYMSPAKKRMLATDPLDKDIPSLQNRLPSSNPPLQGNHCKVTSDNDYMKNRNLPYGYYPGHVPNNPFHPPVTGNYGLALHGPFTPKTWNAPTQHYTSNLESADASGTPDNKFHPLNETDSLSSTKHYLFNKMLDQNDTGRSTGGVLKPAEDNVKLIGDVKSTGHIIQPTGDIVKPSGGFVKPTGFYQEIADKSSGMTVTGHKEKEETELVSTLLTQCQAMAQKDDDRQALHTIFNIIKQEMGPKPCQASSDRSKIPSTYHKPEQTRSFSDASLNGDDAKFSPTSSSPDAASKQNGNNRFEGRTLLKGGVKPRHIPKTVVNKQDDDPPRDPRPVKDKTKSLAARKMKDLPLPPFFIEFVATEKFGKKKNDEGKQNQALKQDAEKSVNEVNNKCILPTELKTTDVKTGIGKIEGFENESNLGIEQQLIEKESKVAETKIEKCGLDTLETKNSEAISHILPRVTVRQDQGATVSDKTPLNKDHYVDINSRDPRLRVTSISRKRDDNPKVDLLVLKYEEQRVGQKQQAYDDVTGKALECVQEPKRMQSGGSKECNEAYLVTNLSRDGLQSRQRISPVYHKDTSRRDTNITRRDHERGLRHCSVPKDFVKQFSERLPTPQRRYSGSENGSTKEIDRYCSSPSRRYSRFSSERSLSRSRSSSRSREGEWTEKEVAIRRTKEVNFSNRNMCLSHSYERNTVVYGRDRLSDHNRNRFRERDEHDRMNRERNSMSPGTCRYLKRRDMERRSTPPSSTNRNVYRSRYEGRRNRNYSEGSDYPESCSSPLR